MPADASYKDILERLVAFDTTSQKTNLPLLAYVTDFLASHGVASQTFPDPTGQKANLHALIGPAIEGGLGLSGHTDVVPVDNQVWTRDPFTLSFEDGRYFGRGTTDMKGFLACVLASVPYFTKCKLKRPVHILFSYDEEIGCIGVRGLIEQMGNAFARPDMVIVGEPTRLHAVDAHKGPGRWRVVVSGRSAHSSMPSLGVNAIYYGGLILEELAAIGRDFEEASRDARFDPPSSTLQVTTISGGSASNIVPATCEIGFGVRALPGFDIGKVERRLRSFFETQCLPRMRAVAEEADISIELVNHVPPFLAAENSPAVSLALSAIQQNETLAVSYATEAGLFEEAGAPSVVCGPGDIAQAHTADEWIEDRELRSCMDFLKRSVEIACH